MCRSRFTNTEETVALHQIFHSGIYYNITIKDMSQNDHFCDLNRKLKLNPNLTTYLPLVKETMYMVLSLVSTSKKHGVRPQESLCAGFGYVISLYDIQYKYYV